MTLRAALIGSAVVVLGACVGTAPNGALGLDGGTSSDGGVASDAGGQGQGPDAGTPGDAGTQPQTDAGTAGPDAGPAATLWVYASSNSNTTSTGSLVYAQLAATGWPPECPVVTQGPCLAWTCAVTAFDAGTVAPNPGDIDVQGSLGSVDLVASADGTYGEIINTGTALFAGGTAISATASGSTLGGFSLTMTTPSPAIVTAPTWLEPPLRNTVSTSADLTLSWTGAGVGEVDVYLEGAGAQPAVVQCMVPASQGSVTIPGALLATLSGSSGIVDVEVWNRTTVEDGAYGVTFGAYSFALLPSGAELSVLADFQ